MKIIPGTLLLFLLLSPLQIHAEEVLVDYIGPLSGRNVSQKEIKKINSLFTKKLTSLMGPEISLTINRAGLSSLTSNNTEVKRDRYIREKDLNKIVEQLAKKVPSQWMIVTSKVYKSGSGYSGTMYLYNTKKRRFLIKKHISISKNGAISTNRLKQITDRIIKSNNYFIHRLPKRKNTDSDILILPIDGNIPVSSKELSSVKSIVNRITRRAHSQCTFLPSKPYFYLFSMREDSEYSKNEKAFIAEHSEAPWLLSMKVYRYENNIQINYELFHSTDGKDVLSFMQRFKSLKEFKKNFPSTLQNIYLYISNSNKKKIYVKENVRFIREFNQFGFNEYFYPYGIAWKNGSLYLPSSKEIVSIDSTSQVSFLPIIDEDHMENKGTGTYTSIGIDRKGNFYLYAITGQKIQKVNSSGKIVDTIPAGAKGTPLKIAVTSSGVIMIVSAGSQGYGYTIIEGEKKTYTPSADTILAATAANDQFYLFSLSMGSYTIKVLDTKGREKKEIPFGLAPTVFSATEMAVDTHENLYFLDAPRKLLYSINKRGLINWILPSFQGSLYPFINSTGYLAVSPSGQDLYISDTMNKRIVHVHQFRRAPKKRNIKNGSSMTFKDLAVTQRTIDIKKSARGKAYIFMGEYYEAIGQSNLAIASYRKASQFLPGKRSLINSRVRRTRKNYLLKAARHHISLYTTTLKNAGRESAAPHLTNAVKTYEILLKKYPGFKTAREEYRKLKARSGSKENRASVVSVEKVYIKPVFSSIYKYYTDNLIGTCIVKNISSKTTDKLHVTLFFKDYMDYPTESRIIRNLKPGESRKINLYAVFTNRILSITEDTPVSAEIKAYYIQESTQGSFTRMVSTRIHNRNAMVWDNTSKLAAYVTHRDPTVKNYARSVVNRFRNMKLSFINENLQRAIQVFDSLGIYGMTYVKDPKTPYDKLSLNNEAIDYVQFPRESLKYKSGDCDDLTVLYASLLEHLGIDTAFITIPGHIFLAFDTGAPASKWKSVSVNKKRLLFFNGTVWIPVEVTSLGETFTSAWEKGSRQVEMYKTKNELKILATSHAWKDFYPVTLPRNPWEAEVPNLDATARLYNKDINTIVNRELHERLSYLKRRLNRNPKNTKIINSIGVTLARFEKYSQAEKKFQEVLSIEPKNAYALTNMGNLAMLHGKNNKAIEYFNLARKSAGDKDFILVNLAALYDKTGDRGRAIAINRILSGRNSSLALSIKSYNGNTARASDKGRKVKTYWAED